LRRNHGLKLVSNNSPPRLGQYHGKPKRKLGRGGTTKQKKEQKE